MCSDYSQKRTHPVAHNCAHGFAAWPASVLRSSRAELLSACVHHHICANTAPRTQSARLYWHVFGFTSSRDGVAIPRLHDALEAASCPGGDLRGKCIKEFAGHGCDSHTHTHTLTTQNTHGHKKSVHAHCTPRVCIKTHTHTPRGAPHATHQSHFHHAHFVTTVDGADGATGGIIAQFKRVDCK